MGKGRLGCRLLLIVPLMAIYTSLSSPQLSKAPPSSPRLSVLQLPDGTLELRRGPKSPVMIKTIAEASPSSLQSADLTIDLGTVDMTPFKNMYRLWSEVPVWIQPDELVILDADHDGRKEIYGIYQDYAQLAGFSRIYRYNGDSSFSSVFEYADTLGGAFAAGDFDGDSLVDLVYRAGNILHIETQETIHSLPTIEKLTYDIGGEAHNVKAYDLNGDGQLELIYMLIGFHPGQVVCPSDAYYVEGYDPSAKNFQVLYCNKPQADHTEGIVVGDFDQDRKQNFATAGINGNLFIYEYQGGNTFSLVSPGNVGVTNAYLLGFTNDMDGDGKPELWIGGDTYVNGMGVTRIFIYEAIGDDTYLAVYTIDILGVFSFYAGNMVAVDVDHDGKEELMLCIDQHVLIFKSNGVHSYYLWYMRTNEFNDAGLNSVIYGATVSDFDNDGFPEILVTMDEINPSNPNQIRYFTRIYKYNLTTGIGPETPKVPKEYILEQNYPNPFNGGTTIRYGLPRTSAVTMIVYDILGKEVRRLRNARDQAGTHEVQWDGRDDEGMDLSSGVYLIRLRANDFTNTIKVLLLR